MRKERANCEVALASIAARQHGVVSAAQLAAVGIPDYGATRRVKAGRLHRVHRGVYAVGHANLSFEGRCLAAALASGEGAVVSHGSAAALWGMLPRPSGPIAVTVRTGNGRRRRPGIVLHRSPALPAGFQTLRANVPVTIPARTLRDLRRTAPGPVVQRAVRRALDLRLVTQEDLGHEPDLTRSELERLFVALCRRHRLPSPAVNARAGPYEVDFLWRDLSLIVETDGFRYHGSRAAFESDRARDARLQALGYRVLRFTYRQLRENAGDVVASLRGVMRSA